VRRKGRVGREGEKIMLTAYGAGMSAYAMLLEA